MCEIPEGPLWPLFAPCIWKFMSCFLLHVQSIAEQTGKQLSSFASSIIADLQERIR